jgi:L-lactate dehydrogenase complex protein LldF
VRINLHELLLENRYESVTEGDAAMSERVAWKVWKQASLHRSMMNMSNGKMKNKIVNSLFKGWTQHRADLDFSQKTFNEMWKEARNTK